MPFSPNLGLLEITPGDPAYRNAWGTGLNSGVFGLLDDYTAGQLTKAVGGSSNVVLTYTDGATCESRQSHYIFTGALTGNIIIFWPSAHDFNFSVSNQTTGAFTLTLAVGTTVALGTSIVVASGGAIGNYRSDGTNILARGGTLSNTAVTPGAYSKASFTVDSQGRLIAASSNPTGNQVFTSSGTFTTPPNANSNTNYRITVIGAGGGNGTGGSGFGSGASGATGVLLAAGLTASLACAVVVGTGGTGATGGGTGNTGGTSSITINATTYTANGGHGGAGNTTSRAAGGAVSGFTINQPGQDGQGFNTASGFNGGFSPLAGSGAGVKTAGGAAETGQNGLVMIEWW